MKAKLLEQVVAPTIPLLTKRERLDRVLTAADVIAYHPAAVKLYKLEVERTKYRGTLARWMLIPLSEAAYGWSSRDIPANVMATVNAIRKAAEKAGENVEFHVEYFDDDPLIRVSLEGEAAHVQSWNEYPDLVHLLAGIGEEEPAKHRTKRLVAKIRAAIMRSLR